MSTASLLENLSTLLYCYLWHAFLVLAFGLQCLA
uniref:Uncharacterized protein n=1 Tax=Rhizophora mucronata TaxID=61149 RepID=A0A2P2QDE9_RHIMU